MKAGREFEILVSRLEDWISTSNSVVQSPDRIPDIDGGNREVDVSIRKDSSDQTPLRIIECRDRSSPQDVTWIEGLVGKRDSICAGSVTAASASGFTPLAKKKARRLGIDLREIVNISKDAIPQWVHGTKITLTSLHWTVLAIECTASRSTNESAFAPELLDRLNRDANDTALGVERSSGSPLTVRSIIQHLIATQPEVLRDVATAQEPVRIELTVTFPESAFSYSVANGLVPATTMKLALNMSPVQQSPTFDAIDYTDGKKSLLMFAKARVEVEPGQCMDLMYSTRPPKDYSSSSHRQQLPNQ